MRLNMKQVPARYVNNDGRPDWQYEAACRAVLTSGALEDDRAIFPFPTDSAADSKKFIKNFCDHCPVKTDCLRYAAQNGYTGVWGGRVLSEADVRKLRKTDVLATLTA